MDWPNGGGTIASMRDASPNRSRIGVDRRMRNRGQLPTDDGQPFLHQLARTKEVGTLIENQHDG